VSDQPGAPAPQLPIELVLLRQVASYLDLPVFLINAEGDLVYFNEPAEPLLGWRFDEVGELSMPFRHAVSPARPPGPRLLPASRPRQPRPWVRARFTTWTARRRR
jgi:PAS domain-containing protein